MRLLLLLTLITACCLHAVFGQTQEEKNVLDEKAAPWWEQQEEAAKRQCQSSCTKYSKGVKPTVNLCDDTDVCPINRESIEIYASKQCQAWSETLNGTVTGEGRQVKHQPVKGNWLACAIFCKHSTTGSWYSPKKELQKLNVNPFFPDGVWCHIDRQTNTNYYCQNNLCMPEAQRADVP